LLIIVNDNFAVHFGPDTPLLTDEITAAAKGNSWEVTRQGLSGYGNALQLFPKGTHTEPAKNRASFTLQYRSNLQIIPSLLEPLRKCTPITKTAMSHLGKYQDLYLHSLDGEADGTEDKLYGEKKEGIRSAVMIHAMNHVLK